MVVVNFGESTLAYVCEVEPMLSVRALLILLVMCTAVPFSGVGVWAIAAAYKREQASMSQTLQETTRALSLAVGRQLGAAEAVARTLAASPDLPGERFEAFYQQAKDVTGADGGWTVVLDADRMLLNTSLPFGSPLPPKRKAVGSRLTNAVDNRADISPLFEGPLTGEKVVAVTVTRGDAGRRFDISVVVPPARIQQVLTDQRLPYGWISTVVDQRGVVVARIPDGNKWIGRPLGEKVTGAIKGQSEGVFQTISLEGVSATAFFHQVPGSLWTLAIAVPDKVLSQNAMAPIIRNASIAACLLAIAVGFALWMARKLLAPALALQRVAQDLQNGKSVSYTPKGVREFDVAGAAMVSAAQRLLSANTDLETRIDHALITARNVQAKVEAAQRQEALKKLTGGVAHDVNNLLATVSTSVALLERRPDDPRRAKRFEAIKSAVETGRDLTQKLLSFSRQKTHDARLIDLREWLPAQLPAVQEKVGPQVIIEINIESSLFLLRVDAAELRTAITNLSLNASQAMAGNGTLHFSAKNVGEGEEAKVAIAIEDTGPGVPVELYARIFEPFFTTDEAHSRTGLGLAQVQSFCELSGGSVLVNRGVHGAEFTMTLPAMKQVMARSPLPSTHASNRGSSSKLLYVEDNVNVGEPTKEVLESLGYDVQWELTAEAGYEAATTTDFEIVLSDYSLPGSLNGLELGYKLRRNKPKTLFLLLTGYAEQGTQAADEGFAVLYKPCPVEQLEVALRNLRSYETS